MTDLYALALAKIACTRCGAGPGTRCVTQSGLRATYLHSARTSPAFDFWWVGYNEGTNEWADQIVSASRSGGWERLIARAQHAAERTRRELAG